jgi:hypothetical protein
VITLFTLIISDNFFKSATYKGAALAQNLTTIRIWIVVAGLGMYSWKNATNQPSTLIVAVFNALA